MYADSQLRYSKFLLKHLVGNIDVRLHVCIHALPAPYVCMRVSVSVITVRACLKYPFAADFSQTLHIFQKGILKQNGSVSKRRRVVFAPVDNLDDEASSDSFSGLEVEVMCLSLRGHSSVT